MKFHFFAYISRMRHIQRWGLMRNSAPENVQEHSHMTAVLAHALGTIGREIFGRDVNPESCATAALYHDASEIMTGDLPTPVKYFNPAIRQSYKEVEAMAKDKLVLTLPAELQASFRPLIHEEYDSAVHAIVKAADKLSAYIKCMEELRAGNTEFKKAATQTLDALKAMELPEIGYFMEHFMPSFSLTIDEME